MSTQQPKPQSYINVAADINFLQRIICCNHDIGNNPADTPKSSQSTARRFDFAEEVPTTIVENLKQ